MSALRALICLVGLCPMAPLMSVAAPPHSALYNAEALSPLSAKLAQLRRYPGSDSVLIVQIGDSHSAADNISGAWRERLQHRYGNGGRGLMPPGVVYPGYSPRQVALKQSPGWVLRSYLDQSLPEPSASVFGITGYQLIAERPEATLRYTADAINRFDQIDVCALMQPDGGVFSIQTESASASFTLKSASTAVQCFGLGTPLPVGEFTLSVQSGAVTLTSISMRQSAGGVVLSNMGVVGAQVKHFSRTDHLAVSAELMHYRPDLLVFEFGTNDGFSKDLSEAEFEATLRTQITRLQTLAPGVPLLILGAPEAARRGSAFGGWSIPNKLALLRKIQKRVAIEAGAAFWDWSERLGGSDYVKAWAEASPAKMTADRVHYTKVGAAEVARMLDEDITAAIDP